VPNFITLLRILIVPFFFSTLLYYQPEKDFLRLWAFTLFLAASITDAIDGLVARLSKQISRLGRFLDPLADKLLLLSGYVGILFAKGFPLLPPLWVIVAIVFRDVVILGGLTVLFISGAPIEVSPNFLGKLTTGFQMATMLSILLLAPFSPALWYGTAFLTIASGLTYVVREMRRLRR
jgi:cardiolipin synthase